MDGLMVWYSVMVVMDEWEEIHGNVIWYCMVLV